MFPRFPYTTLFRSPMVVADTLIVSRFPRDSWPLTVHQVDQLEPNRRYDTRGPVTHKDGTVEEGVQVLFTGPRSEEHTSELQSHSDLVCRLLLVKKKVRYTQDAFSRSGCFSPLDANGELLTATSYMAVGFYVAKFVSNKSELYLAHSGLGARESN